jgi:hypothetical protein
MTEKKLRRAVTAFRKSILDGRSADRMCFAVCAPLQGFLSACGVETELVEEEFDIFGFWTDHVWLKLPDGRIIDPTAGQFSDPLHPLPAIYIEPLPELYRQWIARAAATADEPTTSSERLGEAR